MKVYKLSALWFTAMKYVHCTFSELELNIFKKKPKGNCYTMALPTECSDESVLKRTQEAALHGGVRG